MSVNVQSHRRLCVIYVMIDNKFYQKFYRLLQKNSTDCHKCQPCAETHKTMMLPIRSVLHKTGEVFSFLQHCVIGLSMTTF